MEATVSRDGREIFVEVIASPRPVICIQVIATFGYQGSVGGLSPGAYRVRVTHDLDSDSREVLDTLVRVR